jgi:hypothetical protein
MQPCCNTQATCSVPALLTKADDLVCSHSCGKLLLLLLLLPAEREAEQRSNVFNIPLLASRLQLAVEWMEVTGKLPHDFPVGFFGASTGGSAAACGCSLTCIVCDFAWFGTTKLQCCRA